MAENKDFTPVSIEICQNDSHAHTQAKEYRDFLHQITETSEEFSSLEQFINSADKRNGCPEVKISYLKIGDGKVSGQQSYSISELGGDQELAKVLSSQPEVESICRLFMVESVGPETIALLGGAFSPNPQFFADHLENSPWYQIEDVKAHLPALLSVQNKEEFVRFRFVAARTFDPLDTSFSLGKFIDPNSNQSISSAKRNREVLGSRRSSSRVDDKFVRGRRSVTVWFRANEHGSGWTGIILLDPPIDPSNTQGLHYRTFTARPQGPGNPGQLYPRNGFKNSFIFCLQQDPELLALAISDPFVLVRDLYRIIASEWITVNKYLEKELVAVEYFLETEEPSIQHLETLLKGLYMQRRLTNCYHHLVWEQRKSCEVHGRTAWPKGPHNKPVQAIAADLETDFRFIESLVHKNGRRIAKNIQLLTALISVGESKQAGAKSRTVATLTISATIFLPFSTVAAVLGIQGDTAPGRNKHWVFWAVSIPLTIMIGLLYFLYTGFSQSIYSQLRSVRSFMGAWLCNLSIHRIVFGAWRKLLNAKGSHMGGRKGFKASLPT